MTFWRFRWAGAGMIAALVLTGCGGSQLPSGHGGTIPTTAATTVVRVWFLDKANYDRGTDPYLVSVLRSAGAPCVR